MSVYVYGGAGASIHNANILKQAFSQALHPFGIDVRHINQHDLNNPDSAWQTDAEVLVVGGGTFAEMDSHLQPEGRQAIRDFAARKTCIMICMGAYGASEEIDFLSQTEMKKKKGLGIFNGVAKGSLPIAPELYSGKNDSASIAVFHHEKLNRDFPALYWGGPTFLLTEDHKNVEPLVTFKSTSSDQKLVMAIKVNVGDQGGKALMLGYHPEATHMFLSNWLLEFSQDEVHNNRLEKEISAHVAPKYYFGLAALLDDTGLVPHHSFVDQVLNPRHYDPRTSRKIYYGDAAIA